VTNSNLKEEIFILAHGFRDFSPWLAGSLAFSSMARRKHPGARSWWRKAVHFMEARNQRGQGKTHSSKTLSSK
jgi:hypothetical protein